jgi:hypothetical protein
MAAMFMDSTHLCSKGNSQVFEDSGYDFYFTYLLFNSTPQLLYGTGCTCIDHGFQNSSQKKEKPRCFKSGEHGGIAPATNSGSRTMFRQPLTHFITAMWWNIVVLKGRKGTRIKGHVLQ